MRSLPFVFLFFCFLSAFAQERIELCRSENATVYSRSFKKEATEAGDNYQITIEVENDSFDNLYYSRKENIATDSRDPLLPPYLTVMILNPSEAGKNAMFYIHGAMTLHLSADSTQIFKVTMKRNEHEIKARIRKSEPAQLRCFFNEDLVPWDDVKVFKIKLKP